MLDFFAVDTLRLRFPDSNQADVAVGPGLHGIGRNADGALAPVSDGARMLAQLCIDRRGTWLKLGEGVRTVHVNGRAVKSCTMLAAQANGAEVLTIEGMAKKGKLHPIQQAFSECHGLQCGFCTPGMIMATAGLLKDNPNPTDEEIYRGLEGNLCRCTGYINIVKAVKRSAKLLRK